MGGEDSNRRPLSDTFVLHLERLEWEAVVPGSKVQPPPRSGHSAVAVHEKCLLIYGGEGGEGRGEERRGEWGVYRGEGLGQLHGQMAFCLSLNVLESHAMRCTARS